MRNNWKSYKLGDLISYQKGFAFKSDWYKEKGELVVRISDTTSNSIDISSCHRVDKDKALELQRFKLEEDDIVIATVGSWPPNYASVVGKVVKVPKEAVGALLNQNAVRLKSIDDSLYSKKYIYYLMKSEYFLKYIVNTAQGSANQASIKLTDIFDFKFDIPSFQEQQSIASILSAIDDKIENNLAINKTLEEMAMALYKHWFVDFGPFQDGEFVESELGMIPKGWEVKRVKDFVTLVMGQSPKSEFYNTIKEGDPFHQGVTNYGDRFPEDKTYSTDGNRFAEEGDVLFSVRAPVGRLNIAKNKIILGRGIASMRLKEFKENNFLFYLLKNTFTKDDIIGDGTVYGSVNKIEIENLKFVVPNKSTLNSFNVIILDIDNKYSNNYKENQSLTQLRDTLLPQLISGAVRLKEFRKTVEEVV